MAMMNVFLCILKVRHILSILCKPEVRAFCCSRRRAYCELIRKYSRRAYNVRKYTFLFGDLAR